MFICIYINVISNNIDVYQVSHITLHYPSLNESFLNLNLNIASLAWWLSNMLIYIILTIDYLSFLIFNYQIIHYTIISRVKVK